MADTSWVNVWGPLIVGVAVPALGFLGAWIATVNSRKTGAGQVEVAAAAVRVDEKEANTHEFAVMIDGFTASLTAARDDLKRKGEELVEALGELKEARNELREARTENETLRSNQASLHKQYVEMLFHMFQLEILIPNPPGPPPRPKAWTPYPPSPPTPEGTPE